MTPWSGLFQSRLTGPSLPTSSRLARKARRPRLSGWPFAQPIADLWSGTRQRGLGRTSCPKHPIALRHACCRPLVVLTLGLAAAIALPQQEAEAGLRVCNGSVDLVNVAVGYETDEGLRTEGWWTITANACSQVLQEPLENARYYLHVADGFGESRLAGDITLCIREEKFVLYDGDQCWQRGLIEADFFQVETEGAADWTVLLSYD